MKVLMINGSPRESGNTFQALDEMRKVFEKNGIEAEIFNIGREPVTGCRSCGACSKLRKCVIDDAVNVLAEKLAASDGFVIGSPVYYGSANGTLVSLLDRLFYSNQTDLTMKVGASVAVARRGGCSSTFDELNKYFTIAGMPVASSQYWNMVYGMRKGEVQQDLEGMRTMRVLAENMSFLMKSIALGKEKYGLPAQEDRVATNFIR